jgi:RNA-binding protein
MNADLTGKDRRALRGRAHALKPVVWIAGSGLTPGSLREIDRALSSHELIKIHAEIDARAARAALLAHICSELHAQPVQVIGKMLVAFRAKPVLSSVEGPDPGADSAATPASKSRTRAAPRSPSTPLRTGRSPRTRGQPNPRRAAIKRT